MIPDSPPHPISRHKCLIYEGHPSEHLPVVAPMIVESLGENKRCLYLGDPEMVRLARSSLAGRGVDVEREVARGALIFSSDRGHLDGGFDPEAMVGMLCRLIDDAVGDGFAGLYATGDMRWELGEDRNFERLREYEARLEKVFRDKPLSGLCQYHRDTVPSRAIRDALTTHRSLYVGRELNRDNLFYIPPELLLEGGAESRERLSEWMWQQMSRLMRAESQRDASYRELEERVRERTADLEAFSYSVSHDLRAPLRAIDGYCSLLIEERSAGLDAEGRALLDRAVGAARRMSGLIDALLGLFNVAHRRIERETVDLSRLAERIVAELRAADPGRDASVAIEPGLSAEGDPRMLSAALSNLLGNAWKFTSKTRGARIAFGAERGSRGTVFHVRDNGAGFDAAAKDQLFKAFQRLHAAAEFPGTGIGLATVRRILSRHGGSIWAESSPGAGATFYFTIPGPGA